MFVVDDEESVRTFAERVLRDAGYEVIVASDGPEALWNRRATNNRMTGKIERIVAEKGLGFITAEDGQDYVFHRSALPGSEPFDPLLLGAAVTFDVVHDRKARILRAQGVRIVKPSS